MIVKRCCWTHCRGFLGLNNGRQPFVHLRCRLAAWLGGC
jgi:hypothetical protein